MGYRQGHENRYHSSLERNPSPHLHNLLLDLLRLTLQLGRNARLAVVAKRHEALAQITINDALDRLVVAAVHEVVAAGERRLFGAQGLLQALEEDDVFARDEGHEDAEGAADAGPEDDILATSDERRALDRSRNISMRIMF